MQASFLTDVFLPVMTILAMFGLGLSLTVADFKQLFVHPKAMIIGLVNLGLALEVKARGRTSEAIKRLIGLQAKTARVVREDSELDVPMEDVVVDDVVTTGGSTLAAIEAAEAAGFEIVAVGCLVDREEGGREKLSRWPFHPIFVRSEIFVDPPQ